MNKTSETSRFMQERDDLINKTARTFQIELDIMKKNFSKEVANKLAFDIAYRLLIDRLKKDNPDSDKVKTW
jgi:hypothetical protein